MLLRRASRPPMKPGHLPQPPRSVVADADGPAFRPLGLRSLGAGLLLSASSSSSSSSSASSSAAQRQQQQQQLAWGGQPDDYAQEGSPSRMRLHHPYGGSTYGDMMRSAASTPSLPGSFGSQGQLGGGGAGGLSRRFSQPVALSSSAGISGQGLQEPPQHGFKVYVMLPLDTVSTARAAPACVCVRVRARCANTQRQPGRWLLPARSTVPILHNSTHPLACVCPSLAERGGAVVRVVSRHENTRAETLSVVWGLARRTSCVPVACPQVNSDGVFKFAAVPWFTQALQLLVASGAYGVALDVWVGAADGHTSLCACARASAAAVARW